nr:hypothetical protein [Tanacetum cinerariifolium]
MFTHNDKQGGSFIVNGHHVKLYHDEEQLNEVSNEEISLICKVKKIKAIPFIAPLLKDYKEIMSQASEKPFIYDVASNVCNEAKLYDMDKTDPKHYFWEEPYLFKMCPNGMIKRPFVIKHVYPPGYVELYDKQGGSFIVNGHHVKLYHDEEQLNEVSNEEISLICEVKKIKAIPFIAPLPKDYKEIMSQASEKPFIYDVASNVCNEAKLYDMDKIGKGIVKGNILYIEEGSSEEVPLE